MSLVVWRIGRQSRKRTTLKACFWKLLDFARSRLTNGEQMYLISTNQRGLELLWQKGQSWKWSLDEGSRAGNGFIIPNGIKVRVDLVGPGPITGCVGPERAGDSGEGGMDKPPVPPRGRWWGVAIDGGLSSCLPSFLRLAARSVSAGWKSPPASRTFAFTLYAQPANQNMSAVGEVLKYRPSHRSASVAAERVGSNSARA
ncbi:hypothetical protein B0H66DRAFT_296180 [Apodospora peruviana]|uniref:Uncharacterized protein n=1 Tax=Apodospora peruviana TaxID=516989 RepID=A0AAE0I0T1_9PEZI|nr:hypothetical protein B0H66DRAFT_296180 [Apodospora peruviana]